MSTATSATLERLLAEAERQLVQGRLADASRALSGAAAIAPRHPAVQRVQGLHALRRGDHAAAAAALQVAAAQLAPDVVLQDQLARAQSGAGDSDAAFASWRRACEQFPDSAEAWFNLAGALGAHADVAAALDPLQRCVALAPEHRVARVMLGDTLAQLGRIDEAAAHYREVLRTRPDTGHAWWGLANLKTLRFEAHERAAMSAVLARPELPEHHRTVLGFALGKAHEDAGDHAAAYAAFVEANARMRRRLPWDARAFRSAMQRIRDAFERTPAGAPERGLGREVIFVVSLPRAGSTLVEQILAAHPQVEGACELGDVEAVIRAESARRRRDFPQWAATATPADWQRLGEDYLARTARWRMQRPRSTDKMPGNWIYTGAIRAMLPGARIVDCRRDTLETAWSCFRQVFAAGQHWSYDLADVADYCKVHAATMAFWHARHPDHLREQVHEALLAEPEREIRALLEFCGLGFDPACLAFHRAPRAVRSASAAQVRQPLQASTARTAAYGDLLNALRAALDT